MPSNLLIGAITNYTWQDIAPFFNSYVQAGFTNCECVMFTYNMTDETLAKLKSCGVNTLPIPERLIGGCINDYRWELYRDYLQEHTGDYNIVFAADIRDVIFQQDVFKYYEGRVAFLGAGYEDSDLTADTNKQWLIDRYGYEVWESIKDNRIICGGTIWGTTREFLAFSSAVTEQVHSKDYPYFRICDQCIANWLIYHEKMFANNLVPSGNPDGPVITLGLTKPKDIRIDSQGIIRNTNGEIAAVVHMYDRHRKTARVALSKYGEGMSFWRKFKVIHSYDKIVLLMKLIRRKGLLRSVSLLVRRKFARLMGEEPPMN